MKIREAGEAKRRSWTEIHSLCQHLKGVQGDVRVIEDTDFVLQRLPLFRMSIKPLPGLPVSKSLAEFQFQASTFNRGRRQSEEARAHKEEQRKEMRRRLRNQQQE